MKILNRKYLPLLTVALSVVVSLSIVRCGSDNTNNLNYTQIERLARPAINEGLIRTNASLLAFNKIAPTIDLTDAAASVVAEAAVTLKAIYAGICFVNGALGTSLAPAGVACQATGASILNSSLVGLTTAFDTAAGTYATKVAGQFLPDVLRIDTSVTSAYNGALCNAAAAGSPLLCGGRGLSDNVMDITYAYLFNGEAAPSVASSLRNGTYYNPAVADTTCTVVGAAGNRCKADTTTNSRQGHKALNAAMPFSPSPY